MRYDAKAQTEYAHLREISAGIITTITQPAIPQGIRIEQEETQIVNESEPLREHMEQEADSVSGEVIHRPVPAAVSLDILTEINTDFTGWIIIPGTAIEYPVVRGRDNVRYLNTTFSGERNPAGAIFMDYRCVDGFNAPVCLIYGHNMREGSMFSQLVSYMERPFMDAHPEIIILTADGEKREYRIIEARRTDAWDMVYTMDYNDAEAALAYHPAAENGRLLVLSTCLDGENRHVRLLVVAVALP